MQIELNEEIPGFTMDATMMFAHSTCLADVYVPAVERIYLPEQHVPPLNVNIKVTTKHTGSRQRGSWKWKAYRKLSGLVKRKAPLDFSNQFVFDARFDTDKNIYHILESISTRVLFARQVLEKHLNQDVKIYVILQERASELARQAYDLLDIPVICTDDDVYSNVVEVAPMLGIYSVQPELFNIEIKNYNPATPERVFVDRRGNRSLINISEVRKFLEERGFTTYYFEDLMPSEEWSIMRNAKVAVVNHGAASANLLFNRLGLETPDQPGSGMRIIEIFPACYTFPGYRRLAKLLNGRWCAVRGQITPEIIRYLDFNRKRDSLKSPIKDPYSVDLESLRLALDYLEVE